MAQLKVTTEQAQEPRGHTVSKGGSKGSTGPASQPEQADRSYKMEKFVWSFGAA